MITTDCFIDLNSSPEDYTNEGPMCNCNHPTWLLGEGLAFCKSKSGAFSLWRISDIESSVYWGGYYWFICIEGDLYSTDTWDKFIRIVNNYIEDLKEDPDISDIKLKPCPLSLQEWEHLNNIKELVQL